MLNDVISQSKQNYCQVKSKKESEDVHFQCTQWEFTALPCRNHFCIVILELIVWWEKWWSIIGCQCKIVHC